MTGGDWRGFALEEAELLSGRLKDLLSSGQAYVRSRLGLDLGLEPELYPTWAMLATAAVCALLLLAVSWAAICGGHRGKRKRSNPVVSPSLSGGPPVAKTPLARTLKPEETKKRNAKKAGEKKLQPNGQPAAAVLVQQEVKVPQVLSKLQPPCGKSRKAPASQPPVQEENEKKKSKTGVKAARYVITHDGKEPDEGAWETKVSNREKKQQRRKDKGTESSGGPEGGTQAAKSHVEKKNKGANESQRSRPAAKASPGQGGDGRSDFSAKAPPTQTAPAETSEWASRYRARAEPRDAQTWAANVKSDLDPASFSTLRRNAPAEPPSKSANLQWTSRADDEWGGTNGAEPGSDWNAPAEHWGNYEETRAVTRPPTRLKERTSEGEDGDEDGEDPAGGATKSKRKRKKKKTSQEEAVPEAQAANSRAKPEDLAAAASKKPSTSSSSSSSSSRKRPEQNAAAAETETAKQAKKKVRRET